MEVKKLISKIKLLGACFFCQMETNDVWCMDCEQDFIRETSRCKVCARKSTVNHVCGSCLSRPPYFLSTEILFNYEYPANELIKTFKFNKRPELAKIFANKLAAQLISKNMGLPETIVPVPLHKKRQKDRGYNQSLELARLLGKELGTTVNPSLCNRIINTNPQSSLPMKSRITNVKGVFSLNDKHIPKHIAIVDDVITTGSTINELAKLLKKAGCQRVDVWAIARA